MDLHLQPLSGQPASNGGLQLYSVRLHGANAQYRSEFSPTSAARVDHNHHIGKIRSRQESNLLGC